MANPEEAYQISRWIAEVLSGKLHVTEEEAREIGPPPDVTPGPEGASFELTGMTGTWEVLVREAK